MAYLSSGGGANWASGLTSDEPTGAFTVESRFEFSGTVAPTDLSRATDAREKGRIGITGTAYAYAGASGRVTSEALGRDLNPLGRGDGRAYVAGGLNLGQLYPALPQNLAQPGTGNSVNNGCPPGTRMVNYDDPLEIGAKVPAMSGLNQSGANLLGEGALKPSDLDGRQIENINCRHCCTSWKDMMCEYQKQFGANGEYIGAPGHGWGIPALCVGCCCDCGCESSLPASGVSGAADPMLAMLKIPGGVGGVSGTAGSQLAMMQVPGGAGGSGRGLSIVNLIKAMQACTKLCRGLAEDLGCTQGCDIGLQMCTRRMHGNRASGCQYSCYFGYCCNTTNFTPFAACHNACMCCY